MEKQNEKNPIEEYLICSKFYMTVVGVWPYQPRVSQILYLSIFIIVYSTRLIPLIVKFMNNLHDMDICIEVLSALILDVTIAVKLGTSALKQKEMLSILQNIRSDWESLKDENEIKILSDEEGMARNLNFLYVGFLNSATLTYMSLPIKSVILDYFKPLNESRPKQAPLMLELFLDVEEHFYVYYFHAISTGIYLLMALLASDTFISSCITHACGMLTILGNRVQIFADTCGTGTAENEIKQIVLQHQKFIKFCDNVNSIYSTSFFFVLGLSTIMMSVTGMEIVIKLDNKSVDITRYVMFFTAQIFHLFCYNFVGQRLVNYGEQFNELVYTSNWYMASEKTKTIIEIIIMRSLKPCKLQAIIFPLSLENFTTVMKTSMSYFTVLKSTR